MAEKAKEQQALDHVKKTAKEAAAKVKEMESEAPPLFLINFPALVSAGIVAEVKTHNKLEGETLNVDKPFIVKEISIVTEWGKHAKVQVALGNFGAKYKKKSSYQSDGKVQMALYTREGKEESQELFNSLIGHMPRDHVVDSKDTPAASTCDNVWLYGYDPKLRSAGPAPNGLPMVKLLVAGEVKWVLFHLTSLLAALRIMYKKDMFTLSELKESIQGMTDEKIRKFKSDGCEMQTIVQHPWETLYVPSGWYTAEESVKGVLVYGCRRTLIVRSAANYDQYEALTGVYAASENSGHKHMEAVLSHMAITT